LVRTGEGDFLLVIDGNRLAAATSFRLSVADTYNAMTSDRPYRPALAPHTATANLEKLRGTQLDPVFALTLVALLRASDAAYRVARRSEFIVDFARLDDAMSLMAGNAQP